MPRRLLRHHLADLGTGVKKQAGMFMICYGNTRCCIGQCAGPAGGPAGRPSFRCYNLVDGAGLDNKANGMRVWHMNTRRLVRRSARWVLALWVIAWSSAILDHCCNLLAELADHHSDVRQAQVAHQHDTVSPHAQGEQHPDGCCVSHSAPDTYVSASVGLLDVHRASHPGIWVGVVVFLLAVSVLLRWQHPTYHGPPLNDTSLHLITSRLLI